MKYIAVLALSVFCVGSFSSVAKDSVPSNPFQKTLGQVPAAELPAAAAKAVKQAKARDWGSTTLGVVKASAAINPAATPAVVGAIAKAVPEMAATAAGAAAAEHPKLASAIARAAASAAPSKVEKIVAAVCRAVPNEYRNVALAVTDAVPGSGKEVLKGVAAGVPDLKPGIDKTLLAQNGNVQSVGSALDQAASTTVPSARGPSVGPPYIPLSGTPTTITPNDSGEVPPGGRDYAKP